MGRSWRVLDGFPTAADWPYGSMEAKQIVSPPLELPSENQGAFFLCFCLLVFCVVSSSSFFAEAGPSCATSLNSCAGKHQGRSSEGSCWPCRPQNPLDGCEIHLPTLQPWETRGMDDENSPGLLGFTGELSQQGELECGGILPV